MKRIDDIDERWGLSEAFSDAYLSQDPAQEQTDGWALVQSRLRKRAATRKTLVYAAALIPAAVLLGIGGSRLLSPAGISEEPLIAVIETPPTLKLEDNSHFNTENQLIADSRNIETIPQAAAVLPSPAGTASVEPAGTYEFAEPIAAGEPDEIDDIDSAGIAEAAERLSPNEISRTDADLLDEQAFESDEPQPRRSHRISLGLNARMNSGVGASLLPDPATEAVMMSDSAPFANNATKYSAPQKVYGYEDAVFDHHLPVATGISIAIGLTDKLYAETGLNYTLLRSEVLMPGSFMNEEQKLHFAGIPLKLYWKAADFDKFSLYTGAGGQVEKCLKATLGDESFSEKVLQWSLTVSAGAQYTLSRHISVYLQPEYSVHLNDTVLQTVRSDDHTEFSLRCGLRFNL